jgi:hypothetical protein
MYSIYLFLFSAFRIPTSEFMTPYTLHLLAISRNPHPATRNPL